MTTPTFDRLYARRNDAEAINRHLDDTSDSAPHDRRAMPTNTSICWATHWP